MKKDIEWLKEEMGNLPCVDTVFNSYGSSYIDSAVPVMAVYDLLDQLDNQEVLSQEWIDQNHFETDNWLEDLFESDGDTTIALTPQIKVIAVQDLQNLLVPTLSEMETVEITEEQVMEWLDNNDFYCHATAETVLANAVDKGELGYYGTKYSVVEKPVIPNYVAKWISEHHEKFDLYPALRRLEEGSTRDYDAYKWYRANTRKFVNAYLTGKYEVEEEQKYYAKVKGWGANGNDGHVYYSGKFPLSLTISTESVAHTKNEWRNYGVYEGNAVFVKVEELEE